jgi:hypothetical protein
MHALEVSAVSRGLTLANPLECSRIIIQSNCLQVVETLQAGCCSSTATAVVFEVIYVQASTFSKCEFSFYNRKANAVADCLTRETGSLPCVWVDESPSFIESLLVDDVTII